MADSSIQSLSRSERRKRRTRMALINAAQELARERGLDQVTMQDITEQADVGLGTFYNYFESKTEVYASVREELNNAFFDDLDEIKVGVKDPAMSFAFTLRFYCQKMMDGSDWAWFCQQYNWRFSFAETDSIIQDVQRGNDAGRFDVDDIPLAMKMIDSVLVSITAEQNLTPPTVQQTVHYLLRLLGLSNSEATTLSKIDLPNH